MKWLTINNRTTTWLSSGVSLVLLATACLPHKAFAIADVHFSKYRFIFNDGLRKDSLMISNRGPTAANCNASIEHFIMSEAGPTKMASSAAEVPNPAEQLIRFSPRKAKIDSNGSQVIRISSRRRPGIDDGEYLSYLKVECEEEESPTKPKQTEQIAIKPKFNYFLPIQVRVGKLTATTHFENGQINAKNGNYSVTVDQIREGNRSVIGKIEVKQKGSDDVIGVANNVVIYIPNTKRTHIIKLSEPPKGPIVLAFSEDDSTLGDLTTTLEVK